MKKFFQVVKEEGITFKDVPFAKGEMFEIDTETDDMSLLGAFETEGAIVPEEVAQESETLENVDPQA